MLKAFKSFFTPTPLQIEAHKLYADLVIQSRNPRFYSHMGVADTLDGRFDMIILHLFLATQKLRRAQAPDAMIRALHEAFFEDMDRNLREMGASDTGVGKRVKKMSQAFFGRMQAYEQAMADDAALQAALKRNVFRGSGVDANALAALTAYIRAELT